MPPDSELAPQWQKASGQSCAFRGDFTALAEMIQQSWAENANQPLLYTEAFLRSALDYPGGSDNLSLSVYGDAGLLGFVAGFPRSARWDGRPARLILICFLTASTAVKGKGFGPKLWADLIERCRDERYDGAVTFCVEGDGLNRMMPGLSSILNLNTQRIFSTEYIMRLLRPAPPEPPIEISDSDIDLFMELVSALPRDLPLVRLWTHAEAEWQCRNRAGAITVSSRANGRCGILTGYLMQQASTPPFTVVLLEDLLWGNLELAERTELLERFLGAAAAQGARLASCPMLGYSSLDTLIAAGFRRSKRVVHVYLTSLNYLQPAPLKALYIDIF